MKKLKLSENKGNIIGSVFNVDTRKVLVKVEEESTLNNLKINDIVIFTGNNVDELLIGMITKVTKKITNENIDEELDTTEDNISDNYCSITLVGTFYDKIGTKKLVFKRTVNTYPEINSKSYQATDIAISIIMNAVNTDSISKKNLKIGNFAINKSVPAILNGNNFFQRHACIVGSTGSGKSWAVANMLEKIKELDSSNVIVFDLHGEYNELSYGEHIKINSDTNGLKMPLWFFNYEEIHSLFIESSEGTSVNQRAAVIDFILENKKNYIETHMKNLEKSIVTADIPIPFSIHELKNALESKDSEMIFSDETYKTGEKSGQKKSTQGTYFGKLTNVINRLQSKLNDKKYAFIFDEAETFNHNYLNDFAKRILNFDNKKNIKIIDLSEVPSDILPIIIGTLTRIIYDIQFWMTPKKAEVRHPLVFICDEAHIYMPNDSSKLKSIEKKSLEIFEKIAKEGRKYGIGLLVVTQRPSELNTTIFSQCNNLLCLKITNDRDKSAVNNMLTDSLGGISDILTTLDKGECIVVGDSIILPSKILLDIPNEKPKSATIEFWDKWETKDNTIFDIDSAINALIKQNRL